VVKKRFCTRTRWILIASFPLWAADLTTADVGVCLKSEKLLRKTCGLNMGSGGDAGRSRLPLVGVDVAAEHEAGCSQKAGVEEDSESASSNSESEAPGWVAEQQ
jgi:hypothetical protein